jgi:hypothetical protein
VAFFATQICDTDLDLSTLLLEYPVTATGIDHCEKDVDTGKNKATCEASQSKGKGGCCQWDDPLQNTDTFDNDAPECPEGTDTADCISGGGYGYGRGHVYGYGMGNGTEADDGCSTDPTVLPCAADSFCSFDNGDTGTCERCDMCPVCAACGLPDAGAEACGSACGSHGSATDKESTKTYLKKVCPEAYVACSRNFECQTAFDDLDDQYTPTDLDEGVYECFLRAMERKVGSCRTKIGVSALCRDAKRDNQWFSDKKTDLAAPLRSWCFRVAAIGLRPGELGGLGEREPQEIRIPSVCKHTVRDSLLKKPTEYNEDGTGNRGNIAYSLQMDPQQFVESKDEWCLAFKGDGQKGACDCKDWWLKAIPDPVTFVWAWGALVLVLWCLAALGCCRRREAGLAVSQYNGAAPGDRSVIVRESPGDHCEPLCIAISLSSPGIGRD